MSANLVAELQVKVAGLRVVAEVNSLSIISDDVLCTRVLVVATSNQFLHPAQGRESIRYNIVKMTECTTHNKIGNDGSFQKHL